MNYKNEVVILIPSLNPDDRLTSLVDELLANDFKNIIVVNDGSSNEYSKYFDELEGKALILYHAVNLGKGRALKTGFNEYLRKYNDKIRNCYC